MLVPSLEELRGEGLPAHLEQVVAGLYRELGVRAFRPITEARSLRTAIAGAGEGLVAFCEIWPALLSALVPWFNENPTRLEPLNQAAGEVWTSKIARGRLGDSACAEFAATHDARFLIARSAARWLEQNPEQSEGRPPAFSSLIPLLLSADFSLLFGMFVVTAPRRLHLADGVVEWLARTGRDCARDAYAKIALGDFLDPPLEQVG
jgi:hypothetical protein